MRELYVNVLHVLQDNDLELLKRLLENSSHNYMRDIPMYYVKNLSIIKYLHMQVRFRILPILSLTNYVKLEMIKYMVEIVGLTIGKIYAIDEYVVNTFNILDKRLTSTYKFDMEI